MDEDRINEEKFYVYRSLHHDESWGAIIMGGNMPGRLPNIDFGMKIFASNEKIAISKAKTVYDKIHAYDSDKENIRRFAAAGLKFFIGTGEMDAVLKKTMQYAVSLNDKYNKHFESLEEGTDNE